MDRLTKLEETVRNHKAYREPGYYFQGIMNLLELSRTVGQVPEESRVSRTYFEEIRDIYAKGKGPDAIDRLWGPIENRLIEKNGFINDENEK